MDNHEISPKIPERKSPIAALVERMIESGCKPELISFAVQTCERVRDMSGTENMRAYERERKQRWRQMSRDMSGTNQKSKAKSITSSKNSVPDIEKSLNIEVSKKDIISKASRLSGTWTLPEACRVWALSQGLTEQEIAGQSEVFRDYWTAKAGKDAAKTDWVATWRNWCRKFLEGKGRPINGAPSSNTHGWRPGLPTSEELRAKYAKAKENV